MVTTMLTHKSALVAQTASSMTQPTIFVATAQVTASSAVETQPLKLSSAHFARVDISS
jgi:hypothetical protein